MLLGDRKCRDGHDKKNRRPAARAFPDLPNASASLPGTTRGGLHQLQYVQPVTRGLDRVVPYTPYGAVTQEEGATKTRWNLGFSYRISGLLLLGLGELS